MEAQPLLVMEKSSRNCPKLFLVPEINIEKGEEGEKKEKLQGVN